MVSVFTKDKDRYGSSSGVAPACKIGVKSVKAMCYDTTQADKEAQILLPLDCGVVG